MNFQTKPVFKPIIVLVTNPLCEPAQLAITKIMLGLVFGPHQLVDLIMLVYANERQAAEDLKMEFYSCSFPCINTIKVSTDLPLIEDADVFCFITNFKNPNLVDFNEIDNDQFYVLYLIIKIANSLAKPKLVVEKEEEENVPKMKKVFVEEIKTRRPIIMTDGVVTLNIVRYLTRDSLPGDIYFCPTPLPTIARNVLGDHLKVQSASAINKIFVWGANDKVFHVEVAKPIITRETVEIETVSEWYMGRKDMEQSAKLDYSQFNDSWMRKEFITKLQAVAERNPYGSIYRAADFVRTLAIVWKTRCGTAKEGMKVYASAGTISDGSFETIKDFAYILPLVFTGDTWSVDMRYKDSLHVQQEIKRINETVKKLKAKLFPYCKRFLEDNVKNLAFVPGSETSLSERSN